VPLDLVCFSLEIVNAKLTKIEDTIQLIVRDFEAVEDGLEELRPRYTEGKAMFVIGYDCFEIEHTSQNVADILLKAIDHIGPYNVVQVMTESASNCKGAGSIIRRRHPHIFWSGCLVHTLSLPMKDIVDKKKRHQRFAFVRDHCKEGKRIMTYIRNHTRHGSEGEEHGEVHEIEMDDNFWATNKKILGFTRSIWKMIKFTDSDKVVIGDAYERLDTMLGEISASLYDDLVLLQKVRDLLVAIWNRANLPLHCLSFILSPKYYSREWLPVPTSGGEKRAKPHQDIEVSMSYHGALDAVVRDQAEWSKVQQQRSDFVSSKGSFSLPASITDRGTLSSVSWWDLYGGGASELYSVAVKVLSQVMR
ncbi:uncharacterized protein LOC105420884, partial [Amborella trichopoda]|uniref:uncharacterized protein LOC105420884 n=1 Tax=Amborella trichopoda TaxID=13333 RepID=UPI0005D3F6B9